MPTEESPGEGTEGEALPNEPVREEAVPKPAQQGLGVAKANCVTK